jgi:hypothetical protein
MLLFFLCIPIDVLLMKMCMTHSIFVFPNSCRYCRYCATDPDDDLSKGISGGDVVKESLRRICIWNNYGALDGIGSIWWDYVSEFNERCSNADFFSNKDCIKDAYKNAKVNGDLIEKCMEDSGGTEKDGVNSKLDGEIETTLKRGIVVIPTAYVNTAVIRGAMQPSTVFKAICAGFAVGTAPAVCDKCGACGDLVGCISTGKCSGGAAYASSSSQGVSTHTFATSMLFVICLFGGLGVWHYKRTRDDMRDQVRGILAEYMPLEDQDNREVTFSNPMGFAQGGSGVSLIS